MLWRVLCGVYDFDDGLLWDDGTLRGLGWWWKCLWFCSLVACWVVEVVDCMIVGNDTLVMWVVDHCSEVIIVLMCIELYVYE